MKWKPSAASLNSPNSFYLSVSVLSSTPPLYLCLIFPPCHGRGVLIIQPVSLRVCCDSCRWENSHGESDVQGFLFAAFLRSASVREHNGVVLNPQMQNRLPWAARKHFPIREFVVHAYFTSAISKNIVILDDCQMHNSWVNSTVFWSLFLEF